MYRGDLCTLSLVNKCFGITNTSVQNFAFRISSVETVPKCLQKLKLKQNNIDVSFLLISSLCAIVTFQKYFENHVISSQIHLFARLHDTRHCTLLLYRWRI